MGSKVCLWLDFQKKWISGLCWWNGNADAFDFDFPVSWIFVIEWAFDYHWGHFQILCWKIYGTQVFRVENADEEETFKVKIYHNRIRKTELRLDRISQLCIWILKMLVCFAWKLGRAFGCLKSELPLSLCWQTWWTACLGFVLMFFNFFWENGVAYTVLFADQSS